MNPRPEHPAPPERSSRWLLLLAVVVVFVLLGELWRRIGQASELRQLQHRLEVQATALESESDRLATEMAGAQGNEAVSRWARSEGKMALPGEVLVEPVTPVGSQPPAPAPSPTPASPPNWRIWWEWLWGET